MIRTCTPVLIELNRGREVFMIFAIFILLLVSFFFSGSETALPATNKMKLKTKVDNKNKKEKKHFDLISRPSEFITTIFIANYIANILLPTLVTSLAIQYGCNVGIASAILTITIIVFSEVIPKSVAAAFPNRLSMVVSPIIRFFVFVLKPVTKVLNWLTDRITNWLSKGNSADDVSVSKEE